MSEGLNESQDWRWCLSTTDHADWIARVECEGHVHDHGCVSGRVRLGFEWRGAFGRVLGRADEPMVVGTRVRAGVVFGLAWGVRGAG